LTVPILFVVSGLVAGYVAIYIASRLSGFEGLSRMQYSLDFLRGRRGRTYDEKSYHPISWTKSSASYFLLIVFPWLAYSIADQEGQMTLASIFILILITVFSVVEIISWRRRKKDEKGIGVFEKRAEDWAILIGSFSIALLANVPGAPVWTWAVASPILLLAGIKSLYDAPKELAQVAF
jgi:formate-dependent nitrite reductase membrane component NrfD